MQLHSTLLVFLSFALVMLTVAFGYVLQADNPEWIINSLGLSGTPSPKYETLKFVGIGMGGLVFVIQTVISNKRANAMDKTAQEQANATREQLDANRLTDRGQRQERLNKAIEHLGHVSDSVRMGGAYELVHLARETPQGQDVKELRQMVLDILCAHIRRTTVDSGYREKNMWGPSEEIQSLLTLLFVHQREVFQGHRVNLQRSWLNGADLCKANLENALLEGMFLRKAELREANLRGVRLVQAQLQESDIFGANLQTAVLGRANFQGANLVQSQLQRAWLVEASLQAVDLRLAKLQGANLTKARMQAAEFWMTGLQEADLTETCLQGIRHRIDDNWLPWQAASFAERIMNSVGEIGDQSGVIFEGGVTEECLDSLVRGLPHSIAADLVQGLRLHIGFPVSNELPKRHRAITGSYTEEEAKTWISQHAEAMSEVLMGGG